MWTIHMHMMYMRTVHMQTVYMQTMYIKRIRHEVSARAQGCATYSTKPNFNPFRRDWP